MRKTRRPMNLVSRNGNGNASQHGANDAYAGHPFGHRHAGLQPAKGPEHRQHPKPKNRQRPAIQGATGQFGYEIKY
jgi:hypothetical protein